MSVKINGNQPASPVAPGAAARESKGAQRSGPRHPSIFGRSLFSKAPKNNSTSMPPRASTPLLSPEQRAAPSDSPSWSTQRATSSTYQAPNPPNDVPNRRGYSKEELDAADYYGVEPSISPPAPAPVSQRQRSNAGPATPAMLMRLRPMNTEEAAAEKGRADYHNETPNTHVEEVDMAALARAQQQAARAPRRQGSEPKLMRPMNGKERAQEDERAAYHNESPNYHDVVDHEAMEARRAQGGHQARPQTTPAVQTTPTPQTGARPRPDFDALATRYEGLQQAAAAKKNQGPAPRRQPAVRPEPRMAENVRPRVNGQENGQGGRSRGAGPVPGRNTQVQTSSRPLSTSRPAVQSPSPRRDPPPASAKTADRPVAPLGLHAGNVPQPAAARRPVAGGAENANPNIGRPSQQAAARKNLQAFAESFKLGEMNRDFSPKQLVEAMKALTQGTKFEPAFNTQVQTNPQWGQQMQQNWQALRQEVETRKAGDPNTPSLEQIVGSQKGRTNFIKFLATGKGMERLLPPKPQAPHTQPAPKAQPDAHPQAALTAQLDVLNKDIDDSTKKGKQILHRMFNEPTGAERAAATRESYAHKKEHNELIARRDQVQARLQSVGTDAAAGQLVGKLNDVDGKIAELEQRAGHLNKAMERLPQGSEKWVAVRREKNSLRPAWKELTSQRADLQAKLEGLRPEFQQARELAKGLAELAKVQGGELRHSGGGSRIHLDRSTIENHYDRFDQSRHLLNKRDDMEGAQQQLNRLINSGMLEGIAPKERQELKQLAELDIGDQFSKLNDLKGTVAEIRGALKAMGAGGLYDGINTTPEQRAHDDAEALRNAREARANNY